MGSGVARGRRAARLQLRNDVRCRGTRCGVPGRAREAAAAAEALNYDLQPWGYKRYPPGGTLGPHHRWGIPGREDLEAGRVTAAPGYDGLEISEDLLARH